jgi:hypothetical protein
MRDLEHYHGCAIFYALTNRVKSLRASKKTAIQPNLMARSSKMRQVSNTDDVEISK